MSKKSEPNFQKIIGKNEESTSPYGGVHHGIPWYTMVYHGTMVPWYHGTWYHGGVLQEKVNILAPELFVLNFSFFWSRLDSKKVTQKQGFAYIKIRTGFFSEKNAPARDAGSEAPSF